jgi:hypothetical protein
MTEQSAPKVALDISKKLNVPIALSLRQLLGEDDLAAKGKRKSGAGDLVRDLADMGLDAKDIAEIRGWPLKSVRTLLMPTRRK